jgi:hypothetical protein
MDLALGSELKLTENLIIRGGIRLPSTIVYSFGAGICSSMLQFDIGFSIHPVLGLSSSATVIIKINKHDEK